MNSTKIEYLDKTWNPSKGCRPISKGCNNCWARRMSKRLAAMGVRGYEKEDPFGPVFCHWRLNEPLRTRKPYWIGVSFMGDLFHEDIEDVDVFRVLDTIQMAPQHTFLFLTKRVIVMEETIATWYRIHRRFEVLPNLFLGASVEDQTTANRRIERLLMIPAALHYVSYEPALGPVDFKGFQLRDIKKDGYTRSVDWLIMGAESGPGANRMPLMWAGSAKRQCKRAGIPFFLKQVSKGQKIPEELNIREWPDLSLEARLQRTVFENPL